MSNTRFQIGVHALIFLTAWNRPASSRLISHTIDANPVKIRQIVGDLRDAGLVSSQRGPGGGFELDQPARDITLLDVYRAVEAGPVFERYEKYPSEECPIGSRVPDVLDAVVAPAEDALERWLEKTTIQELSEEIIRDIEAEIGRPIEDYFAEVEAEQLKQD